MSVKLKEVTTYSITDCRELSRAEMLGFIAVDAIKDDRVSRFFVDALVLGPWTIKCIPESKSICYEYQVLTEFGFSDYYTVYFRPMQEDGMQIDYLTSAGSWSTEWSIDEIIDMIGA